MRQLRLFISTILILLAVGCNSERTVISTPSSDVLDDVLTSGKLRAGYIAYPPSLIVNPNTKEISGISADILRAAAKNLGVELEFVEEVGWSSMIEAVDSGRVNIIATSIWPTAARATKADFITPNFYSYVKAYVRNDDSRFDGDLSKANNKEVKIAVIDGEMAASIASSDFPDASTVSLTQISDVTQLLLDVSAKKADLTFVEPAIALSYSQKNPEKIKEVSGIRPVRLFPNSFLIKKGETNLKNTLDIAIDELVNSGEIDRIIQEYEEFPDSFGRVITPTK